jgi:3-mercaptopyruvate sulfurtransferase SseA
MGHEKISILDGGLPRWIHEGFEVDSVDLSSSSSSPSSSPEGAEKGGVLINGEIQVSKVDSSCQAEYTVMGRLRRIHVGGI